ncbi:TPA: LPXTG cell wall anchor domain-containing protein, partial [Staphylococcus aureus]
TPPTTPDEPGVPSTPPTTPDEPGVPNTPPTTPDEPGVPSTPPTTPDEPGVPNKTLVDNKSLPDTGSETSSNFTGGLLMTILGSVLILLRGRRKESK